jgi:hypothetical protein
MFIHPHVVRHWLSIAAMAAGGVSLVVLATSAIAIRRRPSAASAEEKRRQRLATFGQIVDGNLIDVDPSSARPQTIVYTYRIAGVSYQCAQDVSTLGTLVQDVRLDYPVQIRYSRANPANSIVVAETWNGLWTNLWLSPDLRHARAEGSQSLAPAGQTSA